MRVSATRRMHEANRQGPRFSKWVWGIGVFIALLLASAPAALAQPVIDFDIPSVKTPPGSAGGVLSFGGGSLPLLGTSIQVKSAVGLDTPLKANFVLDCGAVNPITGLFAPAPCLLNFTTGPHTASWLFGPNPSPTAITLTGGLVDNSGITPTTVVPGASTIFSGRVSSAQILDLPTRVWVENFIDTKHPDLTAFYGTGQGLYAGEVTGVAFTIVPSGAAVGDPFSSSKLFSGNITNTPIPEPATGILFASSVLPGLMLIKLARRRQFASAIV